MLLFIFLLFFFNATATTEIYTLSLHDALPISRTRWPVSSGAWRPPSSCSWPERRSRSRPRAPPASKRPRSEEHTSELQSQSNLVCRLLLEKKKKKKNKKQNQNKDIRKNKIVKK